MFSLGKLGLKYYGLTEAEYQNILPLIRRENKKVLYHLSLLEICLMLFLVINSYLVPQFAGYRPAYVLFGAGACIVRLGIKYVGLTNKLRYLTHLCVISTYVFSICIGTLCQPEHAATSVCAAIILIPMLIIDRRHVLLLESAFAVIATIILAYIYKSPALFHLDFINCVSYFIVSCYALTKVHGFRIFNLLNTFKKGQEEKERLKQEIEQSRLQLLLGQIKPHFIFNVLNSLSALCLEDPKKANKGILTFSKFLRANVTSMEKEQMHPFSEELENIFAYVKLEQLRYGKKVRFDFDCVIDRFYVPTLSLQPLIENAIRHGIAPKEGSGVVSLKTYADDKNIYIEVADNGVGFDTSEAPTPLSTGIRNVEKRWQYLQNATFKLASQLNEGTCLTIAIPKSHAYNIPPTWTKSQIRPYSKE